MSRNAPPLLEEPCPPRLLPRSFRDYDLTSLRTGIMAGSPCPVEIMRRVQSEMHMKASAEEGWSGGICHCPRWCTTIHRPRTRGSGSSACAAANLPPPSLFYWQDVTVCYGMTETSPVSFQSHVDGASGDRAGCLKPSGCPGISRGPLPGA